MFPQLDLNFANDASAEMNIGNNLVQMQFQLFLKKAIKPALFQTTVIEEEGHPEYWMFKGQSGNLHGHKCQAC